MSVLRVFVAAWALCLATWIALALHWSAVWSVTLPAFLLLTIIALVVGMRPAR